MVYSSDWSFPSTFRTGFVDKYCLIFKLFEKTEGLTVYDNLAELKYPTALNTSGKDDVFVGRIRRDFSLDNGLNLWVVADNIRKGAALNAVQIAEEKKKNNWL